MDCKDRKFKPSVYSLYIVLIPAFPCQSTWKDTVPLICFQDIQETVLSKYVDYVLYNLSISYYLHQRNRVYLKTQFKASDRYSICKVGQVWLTF